MMSPTASGQMGHGMGGSNGVSSMGSGDVLSPAWSCGETRRTTLSSVGTLAALLPSGEADGEGIVLGW